MRYNKGNTPSEKQNLGGIWIHYILMFLLAVIILISVISLIKPHFIWSHFMLVDFSLHSSIEALGAIAAILMAFMPLQVLFGKSKPSYIFISIGFLVMGIWDLFHSFYKMGNGFVFTHGLALLAGGLSFSLILFPWKLKLESAKKYLILTGAITTIILCVLTSVDRTFFPEMVRDGEFTVIANAINLIAGIFFFLSAIKLIAIYFSDKNLGVLILVFIAVSSGIVGITFQFSEIWTDGWWLWHIIRLIAFLATLTFMLWRIQKVSADLNLALINLNDQYLVTTESEKKFKGLFNNDPSAIIIADPFTGILYDVNPAAEVLMGMNRNELIGLHQSKLHPEDIMEEQIRKFEQLKNKSNVSVDSEVLTKKGERKHVEIKVSMVEIENKPFVLGIFHDISKLINHQNQLKQSEEKQRAIFDALPGLYYQISPEGKFTKWNKNFEIITGYSALEIESLSPIDLFEGEEKVTVAENIQKVYKEGQAYIEADIVTKDGTTIPYVLSGKKIQIGSEIFLAGMGLDMSAQKQTRLDLQLNEEKFRNVFENSPIGKSMTDIDGSIHVNQSFCEMLGYTKDELKTKKWHELTHPEDIQKSNDIHQFIVNGEIEKTRYEKRYIHKNGTVVWTDVSTSLQRDSNKNPLFFITTVIDITQKKKRENELILKNIVFESSVSANSTADVSGILTNVNPAFFKMWGYEKEEEVVGRSLAEFIKHEDEAIEIITSLNKTGKWAGEYVALKKDNTVFNAQANASTLIDADGHFIGYQSTVIDVTEKRAAEMELKKSKETLELALNGGEIGIWEWDLNTNVTLWDERMEKMFGLEVGSFGKDYDSFKACLHPDDIQFTEDAIQKSLNDNVQYNVVYRVVWKTGEIRYVKAMAVVIWDEKKKPLKMIGACTDLTVLKRSEQELKNAAINLERSNQELEQFAYIASHDLQEPLRMVSSYTQLLEKRYGDKLDQNAKDFIGFAVDGATRMQRLINDLLDYSRVTTRGKPFEKIDLTTVLGYAIANLFSTIQETGAIITNDELPFCWGDESQLIRVFQNLIGNGIKFTTEAPRIHVSATETSSNWTIEIKDNGIGIEPQYQERIFTIFQRLHNKTEYPGTGLGLAICKRTIERHGGTIWYESEFGNGTTFKFTLNKLQEV